MNTNTQTILTDPQQAHPKPPAKVRSKEYGWNIFLLLMCVVIALGYLIATQNFYEPGDDLGYNMGLVGGLMLLSLLLYPLRKRARFLSNLGFLPVWFKWHMIFGILAPTLILFHTSFSIGSINAGVALIAMLLVASSGIFGRFFYSKIHKGLYGRQAHLKDLQEDMATTAANSMSFLSFAAEIGEQLDGFRARTVTTSTSGDAGFLNFATIGIRSALLSRSLVKNLHQVMYPKTDEANGSEAQRQELDLIFAENSKKIKGYIKAVRDIAQFHTYQRLFSWWHIFHIPLVYMLVLTGIFHVIAVHMY